MTSPRPSHDDDQVYRISAANKSLSDDIDVRTRRYLISMGIRTLCFIGAVISFLVFKQPAVGWVLLAGALILPYIAVVVANAGTAPSRPLPTATLGQGATGLTAGPATNPTAAPPTDTSTDASPGASPGTDSA